ncbi:AAA family ATPase [Pseudomonas syringae pv. syringae]|uniref:AAA family ATPase n=1 Tax=Pseudomonas TaxID=286 RepID=UPI001F0EC888|nr:AAA family ATPase [Pseudomonas syringae]MCH5499531.1 AAA family ATPase [Pseudomonas syringae pv. syringae]MCH5525676.1 AAA family ATPase [Pseudomonas syringae pv. syringae]MCH5560772.1 AAA family ATPase [Pseudomonas syringae pv. syringae]MCH5566022.1 AAA family ATPase [Pseudomonas syringae pv. syringae]MCH5581296.1 AAA family ATPase [Pseudomonas syringae pv. syringae]
MGTIVIVGGNKGGVGKTTTAVNVSTGLAMEGHDVCLVDADAQRSASKWYAEREAAQLEPKITLIEKRDNITVTLRTLSEKFDYVIVDVAGRNSRELITGAVVADIIIAPNQCSQLDLDTLGELQEQVMRCRDLNPNLQAYAYQSMASPNPAVRITERREFLEFLSEYPEIKPLDSVGFYRKAYKDSIPSGMSVLEGKNREAANEIKNLLKEVFHGS